MNLPPDWRRLARILDLGNLCSLLDHEGQRPRMDAELVKLLERSVRLEG